MKRTLPWSENDSDSSSDESSSRDTNASDSDEIPKRNKKRSSKTKPPSLNLCSSISRSRSRSAAPSSPPSIVCSLHRRHRSPQIMGSNVDVVDCETLTRKNKPKIVWANESFRAFVDACLIELRKGNRPGSHFNKVGWSNLEKTMLEKTGKKFDRKQLKNKWDNMKKDWKLYDHLMRLETGIGGTRSLIDASPEWWEEKIKVDKDFAKFKDADLSIYETHYAPLFRDSVAVGDQTMTPLQFQNNSNPNDAESQENMEGKGDSDEINLDDDEPLFSSFPASSSSKRKNGKGVANSRSTKSKTSAYIEKLDVIMDAISTKITQTYPPNNPSPALADCMNIVNKIPGFNEGSKEYSKALLVFTKKQNREAFMFPTTDEAKMEFLKLLMEQ